MVVQSACLCEGFVTIDAAVGPLPAVCAAVAAEGGHVGETSPAPRAGVGLLTRVGKNVSAKTAAFSKGLAADYHILRASHPCGQGCVCEDYSFL